MKKLIVFLAIFTISCCLDKEIVSDVSELIYIGEISKLEVTGGTLFVYVQDNAYILHSYSSATPVGGLLKQVTKPYVGGLLYFHHETGSYFVLNNPNQSEKNIIEEKWRSKDWDP